MSKTGAAIIFERSQLKQIQVEAFWVQIRPECRVPQVESTNAVVHADFWFFFASINVAQEYATFGKMYVPACPWYFSEILSSWKERFAEYGSFTIPPMLDLNSFVRR